MRAGSRHQNPLATMLCNFKAKTSKPGRQMVQRLGHHPELWQRSFPFPDKYFSFSGQALRGDDARSKHALSPAPRVPADMWLTAPPQCVEQAIEREKHLIRGGAQPRRPVHLTPHSPDRPNPASLAQRQQAQSRACGIDRNQSTAIQLLLDLVNGSKHSRADEFGSKKITAQLEDTGASALCRSKNSAEVKVTCEHDVTVCGRPLHHVTVIGVARADFRPVNGLKSSRD
jgi:hypothetical protein